MHPTPLSHPADTPNAAEIRPTLGDRPTPAQIALWAALTVTALVLILRNIPLLPIGIFGDDSEYVVLARSFVYGPHFGLINSPGIPYPTRYPFGFPLLLSPFVRAFPHSLTAMKALSVLATMANSALLFWGWRGLTRRASHNTGLAVLALYALAPIVVGEGAQVMSEPVFTTGCLVTLLLVERAARGEERRGWTFWLALALLVTAFIRTIGALMIPVACGYLLWRRGRAMARPLALVLVQMAALIGLLLVMTPLGVRDLVPVQYAQEFHATTADGRPTPETHLSVRLAAALRDYFGGAIAQTVVPLGGGTREDALLQRLGLPGAGQWLPWLISLLVVAGAVRWVRREGVCMYLVFSVLYFGAILLWPWRGPRFLYPVQPALAFAFLLGLEGVFRVVTARRARGTQVALLATVGLLTAGMLLKDIHRDTTPHIQDLAARNAWLRTHAPASAILLSPQPPTDYLYSGLKTVGIPESYPDPAAMEAEIVGQRVSYVLIAPDITWTDHYVPSDSPRVARIDSQAQALVAQHHLRLAWESPADKVKVYQAVPTP